MVVYLQAKMNFLTALVTCILHGNCSYGDAVRELDYGVGVILKQLQTLGIDKDTLVIFSSDNGAATYDKAKGSYSCLPVWI